MSEGEDRTKQVERQYPGEVLPVDIEDRAPTDQGVEVFMSWLSDNLRDMVEGEVSGRKDFTNMDGVDPITKDSVEGLYEDYARARTRVLWRYINYRNKIHLAEDPKTQEQFAQNMENAPEEVRKKLKITPEQLRQRQIGVETVIRDMRLDREKGILDHLFDQAAAIPGSSGEVIEGKFLPEKV